MVTPCARMLSIVMADSSHRAPEVTVSDRNRASKAELNGRIGGALRQSASDASKDRNHSRAVSVNLAYQSSTIQNPWRTEEGGLSMSEKIEPQAISRRGVLSLLGLATASSVAIVSSVLTPSDAEAYTYGMARRQTRRYARRAYRRGYY